MTTIGRLLTIRRDGPTPAQSVVLMMAVVLILDRLDHDEWLWQAGRKR